jgi:threonine aldolase
VDAVNTNIVFFGVNDQAKVSCQTLVEKLKEDKGVLLGAGYWEGVKVRAVTNLHVTSDDIEYIVAAVREIMA